MLNHLRQWLWWHRFRVGARRGYADYLAGRTQPWSEVKKELGL